MDDINLSTPIACTLSVDEQKRETKGFQKTLRPHVISQEKLPDGARITFRNLPSVAEGLNQLVDLDADCCQFLTHKIDDQGDEISLTTRSHGAGIALAQEFLTELAPVKSTTDMKIAGLLGVCGLACASPFLLGALGIGAVGSLGAPGMGIAILGVAIVGGIGYGLYRKSKSKGKVENANRCGC